MALLIVTFLILLTSPYPTFQSSLLYEQPKDITFIDLRYKENLIRHHTSQYKQNTYTSSINPYGRSIVLRRGEEFSLDLKLNQAYDESKDLFRLGFGFGSQPQLDKGTLIYVPVEKNSTNSPSDSTKWSAQLQQVNNDKLSLVVKIPTNIAIGVWKLRVSTKVAGTKEMKTFMANECLFILFNAWNKHDAVFMDREDARQEYVLNDVGKIYIGSHLRTTGRKWTYGQFQESVLPAVMYMLDRTRLDVYGRADVVKVSRAVSALVNSHDDNGLLVGNWSGNYGDGLAPWQWTGSAVIFDKYLQSGARPVKFGQCWVFGGVTTTTLRTLGIPARTVSNFVSAHDTDLSLTVDKFYSESGEEIEGINGDSIWNFHVWSDAWMARYDLPPGYGGWQAIDATPQERSMNRFQLGPASLEAIKQGKVAFAYDVGFVFSEVNADLVHWRLSNSKAQWYRTRVHSDHVGRRMLTKAIGYIDERSLYRANDAENVVGQYKFTEGSKEERLAFQAAARSGGLSPMFKNW